MEEIAGTSQGGSGDAVEEHAGQTLHDVQDDNEYTVVSDVTYVGIMRSGAGGRCRVDRYTVELREDLHTTRLDVDTYLKTLAGDIATAIRSRAPEVECRLNVRFAHSEIMDNKNGFNTGLLPPERLTKEVVYGKLAKLQQSNDKILVGMKIDLDVNVVQSTLSGRGKNTKKSFDNLKDFSHILPPALLKMRSLVKINNDDNLCLIRCIAVGMAHVVYMQSDNSRSSHWDWTKIRNNIQGHQDIATKAICEEVGIDLSNPSRKLDSVDIQKVEMVYKNLVVVVFDCRKSTSRHQYITSDWQSRKECGDCVSVLLYLADEHYFTITSPAPFFKHNFFCFECLKAYNHKTKHYCIQSCAACKTFFPEGTTETQCEYFRGYTNFCGDCNRGFFGVECYKRHLRVTRRNDVHRSKNSTCQTKKCCKTCNVVYDSTIREKHKQHKCFHYTCSNCKCLVPEDDHKCFFQQVIYPSINGGRRRGKGGGGEEEEGSIEEMRIREVEEKEDHHWEGLIIAFDCETCSVDPTGLQGCHQVQWKTACHLCANSVLASNSDVRCETCMGGHPTELCITNDKWSDSEVIIKKCRGRNACGNCSNWSGVTQSCSTNPNDNKAMKEFLRWVLMLQKTSMLIAHNMAAYDGLFMMGACSQLGLKYDHIADGTKIIQITIGDKQCKDVPFIKVLDSCKFMQMSLKALPKSLGLKSSVKKGWFPHTFNKPSNWNYIGAWPEAEYYQPDYMPDEDREEFLVWWAQMQGREFNFNREMLDYCLKDVEVLLQAVLQYRKDPIEALGMDPFYKTITCSSFSMEVFVNHELGLMKPNSIGIIPGTGYNNPAARQSKIAIHWLESFKRTQDQYIRTRQSPGGEAKILGRRVDGFDAEANTVYQFHG